MHGDSPQALWSTYSENNLPQYLPYSFGEIALIIIGILIALQLDNWNESRKEEVQFNYVLEQAYNVIHKLFYIDLTPNRTVLRTIYEGFGIICSLEYCQSVE